MKLFFQLALGLCPAVILFLVLMLISIKKKRPDRILNISLLSVFSTAAVVMLVLGFVSGAPQTSLASAETSSLNLQLACAVANEGDPALSLELLDTMREQAADSAEVAEYTGWIYAAQGKATTAKALFVKANTLDSMRGYKSAVSCCDKAIAAPDSAKKQQALVDMAKKQLEQKASSADVKAVGKVLVEADAVYDNFLLNNQLDTQQVTQLVDSLDDACDDNEDLNKIQAVRVCKVKLLALTNDYDGIAKQIDDNAGFDELAIVAELYINDLVDSDDFSDEYGKSYAEKAKAVAVQLKKIENQIPKKDLSKRKHLKEMVKTLQMVEDDPAVGRLHADLIGYANDEQSPHRPKAYMQLARLEYAEGNDDKAAEHISSALNTIGVSEDDNFATPMIGIVDSITDKEHSEKMKDIAQYAEDVTNNSSDYVVVKSIESYQNNPENRPQTTPNPDGEGEGAEPDNRNPFEIFFADTASQKRNAFSITSVDATKFDTVKLVVNVDPSISITADELKELISLKDCNVEIENFSVEKVEYSGANILLCCDTSGSMGGSPIADLRAAVEEYIRTSADLENISLVTFEGGVDLQYPFGTAKDEMITAAQGLNAGGGTNMYGAICHSIGMFTPQDNELNYILLMSDGADGYSPTNEEIQNNIGAACKEKGIVLFSLGLGSGVNADYMDTLASATGGYFVYVNDSATLTNFYEQLRSQILNRYIITFTAKDTLRASRTVTISLKDTINNNIVSASKDYQMNGTDVPSAEAGADSVSFEGFSISGLDTRRVFKNSQAITVDLKGHGFTDEMAFSVRLDGKLDYKDIQCTYVDSKTMRLRLPGGMACGVYDLVVTVNDKTGFFPDELTVSAKGAEKTTTFGHYIFTSDSRTETSDGVLLSGYVTMNGWLHFKGDVKITGNLTEQTVQVTDMSGSYVQYYADSAEGLAKFMAKQNIAMPMAPLGTFRLYNDPTVDAQSEEHRTDKIPVPLVYLSNVAAFQNPSLELFPNRIVMKSDGFNTKLPMQDTLLKAASVQDLYSFKVAVDATFTNTKIGLLIEANNKSEYDDENPGVKANFGNQSLKVDPAEFEIKLDTIKNEFMVDLGVKFAFMDTKGVAEKNKRGLGLKLEWAHRDEDAGLQFLCPKTVEVRADFPINAKIGPVPVTYRDFALGLTDIDPNKNILYWKLVGRFDLETTRISHYVGDVAEFIGDPALFKFDDNTVTLSLGQAYLGLETKAKLLDTITLGELKVDIGKFDYTCAMLDMYDQSTIGLKAALKVGVMWKTNNVDIDVFGEGILNLHSRFLGVEMGGKCDLTLKWWIFDSNFYKEGRFLMGVMNDTRTTSFVIKAREATRKGAKDFYVYINGNGVDAGTKKL